MKRIFNYIGMMAVLLTLLAACSDSITENGGTAKDEDGMTSVNFSISMPSLSSVESRTTNFATEGITSNDDMKLMCFDQDGYFLGLGKEVTIDNTAITDINTNGGTTTKNIKASIPNGTARMHIVANMNADNTVFYDTQEAVNFSKSAEWIGRHENNLMTSFENKTQGKSSDKMIYWGYVKKDNAKALISFLNKTDGDSSYTIHLLRNRAKIEVDYSGNTSDITNIRFAIGNAATYGTVAPFKREKLSFPSTNELNSAADWKNECTYITAALNTTRYPASGETFTMTEGELSPDVAQYTFEQQNTAENPLKVVMEVTYKDGTTKWFLMLIQSDGEQLLIKRNHLYKIIIKRLNKNLGYDSADKAYNGSPANNPWNRVDDIIQEIYDGSYTMEITDGTYLIHTNEDANSEKTINFTYTGDDDMTADNFSAVWTSNQRFTEPENNTLPAPTLTYDASTHKGTITYKVGTIEENFKNAVIRLTDKKHGLNRSIHLYSIKTVDFAFSGQITMGKDVSATYPLSLNIPAGYPEEMLPIEIRMASNDVNPLDCDVEVASTSEVDNGAGWNCWFLKKFEESTDIGKAQTITLRNTRTVTGSTGVLWVKAKYYNGGKPKKITINYQ